MGDSQEHGQPDRWGMEQRDDSGFSVGVPLGGSDVRCRNGHPLVTDQLEEKVSAVVHIHAVMADDDCGVCGFSSDLSICIGRNATVYLFPILI